jgi:elongation factor Ts
MDISANDVKTLRDRTGMQMMKCKAALIEAQGDMDKAVEILRKQNKEAQDKVVNRETAEGRIGVFIDTVRREGGIIEVRCESAPVAKSDLFVQLTQDLAKQVAMKNPANVEDMLKQAFDNKAGQSVNERIGEVVGLVRENIKVARFTRLVGLLGHYVHHDGTIGVLVQVEGDKADVQLLRDVAMHITAKNPAAALREHVAEERVSKEKEIAKSQVESDPKSKGKPAQIIDKIIEGKLKTWFAESVLVDQIYVKDEAKTKTVGQLLQAAGLTPTKFVRYRVGELA